MDNGSRRFVSLFLHLYLVAKGQNVKSRTAVPKKPSRDMVVLNMQVNVFDKKTLQLMPRLWLCALVGLMIITTPLARAVAAPPVVLVLGDSLVAGHGLPQGRAFPDILRQKLMRDGIDVTMINAGVSGDTTAGGRARLDWSLAEDPDAAIIVLGGNDLLRGLDPQASVERPPARTIHESPRCCSAHDSAPPIGRPATSHLPAHKTRVSSPRNVLWA